MWVSTDGINGAPLKRRRTLLSIPFGFRHAAYIVNTHSVSQPYLDSLEPVGLMADERSASFLDNFLHVSSAVRLESTM